jgi:dual specificity tyrosine-phosphorylation-regulated kinase 2/3/4
MLRKEQKTGVKIIDLGSGCFEGEQIYNYIQSRFYRAP